VLSFCEHFSSCAPYLRFIRALVGTLLRRKRTPSHFAFGPKFRRAQPPAIPSHQRVVWERRTRLFHLGRLFFLPPGQGHTLCVWIVVLSFCLMFPWAGPSYVCRRVADCLWFPIASPDFSPYRTGDLMRDRVSCFACSSSVPPPVESFTALDTPAISFLYSFSDVSSCFTGPFPLSVGSCFPGFRRVTICSDLWFTLVPPALVPPPPF